MRGTFKIVNSGNNITTLMIVDRIVKNRYDYIRRNNEKEMKEIKLIMAMEENKTKALLAHDTNNNHHQEVTACVDE